MEGRVAHRFWVPLQGLRDTQDGSHEVELPLRLRSALKLGADFRIEDVELLDNLVKLADHNHGAGRDQSVHEAEAEHLHVVVAVAETVDDGVDDLGLVDWESVQQVLQ